jgi:hypothetical protein
MVPLFKNISQGIKLFHSITQIITFVYIIFIKKNCKKNDSRILFKKETTYY